MRRPHTYSHATLEAARVLGLEVARARRARRWTAADLAERAGISLMTLRKVERGDPSVALGTAFEVATLLGVPLFGASREELSELTTRGRERLALLPSRVRRPATEVHDAF
ncbi:MAG TPA: helix-turn-helix transcriptional regulator [Acidimicrobiales bacterium]